MNEVQLLAGNARVELEVEVESLHHFRPRKGESSPEATVIQLSPVERGPYFAKILDEREDSVLISRGVANIRTAEKRVKSLLDQKKVEQAKTEARENWPEFFGLNASVLLDYEEVSSGRRHPVLILRDPENSENEGLLTAISFDKDYSSSFAVRQSRTSWLRMVLAREGDINHFLLLTLTSKESPITIFHRKIDGDVLVATDYLLADSRRIIRREATITKEEWLEGEPLPEAVASFEEETLEEPAEEQPPTPVVGKNGKVQVDCPECEKKVRVGAKKLATGQARCPKCKKIIEV